jgi:hypothetical protein
MAVGTFILATGVTMLVLSLILTYLGAVGTGYGFFTGSYLSLPYQTSFLSWLRFTAELAYAGAFFTPIGAAVLAFGVGSERH